MGRIAALEQNESAEGQDKVLTTESGIRVARVL